MNRFLHTGITNAETNRITGERRSQHLVVAFMISGLLFMLLPGTFLGVWNLLSISGEHQTSSIPQAWLQAHGQAQIFGWIGSFILGIGLYSLTKMKSTREFPALAGWIVWTVWTAGVLIRWLAGVAGDAWHITFPLSGVLQLAAFILFFVSVHRHQPESNPRFTFSVREDGKRCENKVWAMNYHQPSRALGRRPRNCSQGITTTKVLISCLPRNIT